MTMIDYIEQISRHYWLMALLSTLTGYLAGSVSFARIVHRLVLKSSGIESFAEPVPHSDEVFESTLVSATLINKKLGARYGCITSLLDMVKVVLPILFMKIFFTSQPWFLLTGLFGIIGHNYPVWYRFRGGRGESPIIGALLVINWFGILIVNAGGLILGFITGSVLVMRWSGYILMVFWFWIYFRDWRYVAFMILANALYWFSMRKDLTRFNELKKKKGLTFTEEDVSEFILMGKTPGRMLDRYSLYALIRKKWHKK